MSRLRFHSSFATLALVAMLLLALLPAAGRIAGAADHTSHTSASHTPASESPLRGIGASMRMAAHLAHGHDMHGHSPQRTDGPARPAPARRSPSAPGHDDCDYCPLFGGLATLAAFLAFPPSVNQRGPELPVPVASLARSILVPGLGARGPPSLRI